MNETLDMRGAMTLWLTDRAGNIMYKQHYHNRIVSSGRMLVARLFGGDSEGALPTPVTHIAVGTDSTAPKDEQTQLLAERFRKPFTANVTCEPFFEPVILERQSGGAVVGDPVVPDKQLPGGGDIRPPKFGTQRVRAILTTELDYGEANGAEPLCEAGIFNAATEGIMYNRVTFNPVVKSDNFKLTLIWEIVF